MLGSPRNTTTEILQRGISSCVHISKLCLFVFHTYIHTYIYACMHTCTFIDGLSFFPKICIYTKNMYIYTYMCVSCVFLMLSRKHIQAEVLSVWFPKEYVLINLAAKHPKLCTYLTQYPVYWFSIHTSMHTYMHACIHAHLLIVWFFQRYVYTKRIYIYVYIHVCGVFFFDVF